MPSMKIIRRIVDASTTAQTFGAVTRDVDLGSLVGTGTKENIVVMFREGTTASVVATAVEAIGSTIRVGV